MICHNKATVQQRRIAFTIGENKHRDDANPNVAQNTLRKNAPELGEMEFLKNPLNITQIAHDIK
jgi:hypothetical protein